MSSARPPADVSGDGHPADSAAIGDAVAMTPACQHAYAGQGATPVALAGVTVVDLSTGVSGQFCGRLFADNGAHVTLVEPPGGVGLRGAPPLVTTGGEVTSCLFWHLAAGKHSRVADLSRPADLAAVTELAGRSDVVIIDDGTPHRVAVERALAGLDRRPVVARVTPFGTDGPYANRAGGELIYQAQAGVMFESGEPGRPPLYGVGRRASYAAGSIAYLQAVSLLLGTPDVADAPMRLIDVATAEVAASMCFCRLTQFDYNGEIEGRDARTIPRALIKCADGWVSLFIYDHRWRASCAALGLDDLAVDPRFQDEHQRLAHWDEFTAEVSRRFATEKADDIVARGQAGRAVVARAMRAADLGDDPQLRARGFWRWNAASPRALPRLGPMYGFSATPQTDHGPAPVLGPPLSADREPGARSHRAAAVRGDPYARRASRPLTGVRVLDFTTAWAGPMATRLLATLGCDVIKVEGPARIDDWRGPIDGGLGSRYPDHEPGDRPYDRCYQFNTQNHDKRGIAIDLKTPDGLAIARVLAREADVVIANFSVGVLDRIGLGYAQLSADNPALIVVEMPAYGDRGPYTSHVALGPSMELMSAMATLVGYGDGRPVTTGPAYLDPIGGFNAAAAVVTAIAARQRTGLGQHVEMAQREAAMHWVGEEIVYAMATGAAREPSGNRHPDAVPHNAFRARGDDEWVAIAAYDDAQYAALARVPGLGGLARPEWATLAGRRAGIEAIEDVIAVWAAERDKHAAAEAIAVAGVPAAAVHHAADLARSPFLAARGLAQPVDHPQTGRRLQQGLPLHVAGIDLSIRAPAPTFGEHTRAVLNELGRSPAEIERLFTTGVAAQRPRKANP